MTTLNDIQKFLEPKRMAIAGASRNPKKFGGAVFKELKEKGYELYPINPEANEIQGVKCYHSVELLPDDVSHLFIITPRHETAKIAKAAIKKGIKMVWIQQKSETMEAVEIIQNAGIPLIFKKCIMMFAEPNGPHKVHQFLAKFFGAYPKLAAPSVN